MVETLTAALLHAAERFPDRGVGIYDGRGRSVERRTYEEIVRVAVDNRVRVTTPAWSVTAGEPAFSIQYSEVRVTPTMNTAMPR